MLAEVAEEALPVAPQRHDHRQEYNGADDEQDLERSGHKDIFAICEVGTGHGALAAGGGRRLSVPFGVRLMDVICDSPRRIIGTARRRKSEWLVAALRCYELGLELRGAPSPEPTPRLSADPTRAVLAELLAAAVCHSTNWDRLRDVMRRAAADPERFQAARLATLNAGAFRDEFGAGFAPAESLLARHRVFTETASLLAARRVLDISSLAERPVRLDGRDGLYDRLDAIPVFGRDPEAKKARVLVQELCRTRLIMPTDPQHVRPAIEYHLIRLYLRTQRVTPVRMADDSRLLAASTFRAPVIMRIRRAVEEAMHFTASAAEMPICDLNHIEWQIARSFCERQGPRCDGPPRPSKPCNSTVLALAADLSCPFAEVCGVASDSRLARLVEPQLSRKYDFY